MKKLHFVFIILFHINAVQTFAQCDETHLLCRKHLSKEDRKAEWFVNQQSLSIDYEKGQEYETTLTAYKGYEYRLSVCTDIDGGTPAIFQLSKDVMVTVTDATGNTTIERQRKVIFDNSVSVNELYVLFRSEKNEKFYLTVTIPHSGKSACRSLKDTDNVSVGVLLEHRRVSKSDL